MSRNRSYLIAVSISVFLLNLFITAEPRCLAEGTSYVITLTNGGTLTANSCRAEDDRLILGYPVGDAVIPMSSVESVKSGDMDVLSLLQEKGEYVPPAKEQARPAGTLPQAYQPGEFSRPVKVRDMPVRMSIPGAVPQTGITAYGAPADAAQPYATPADDTDSSSVSSFAQHDSRVDRFVDEFFSGKLTDDEIDREMDALFGSDDGEPDAEQAR